MTTYNIWSPSPDILGRMQTGELEAFDQEYARLCVLHETKKDWRPHRVHDDDIAQQKEKVLEIIKSLNLKELSFKWSSAPF